MAASHRVEEGATLVSMNERSTFRRELAAFLEQRHLGDVWTWLMLPEDATPVEIHERIEDRCHWAEDHEFDADYATEATFLLKWRGFLEQELTLRAGEWNDTASTVIAPRGSGTLNRNLAAPSPPAASDVPVLLIGGAAARPALPRATTAGSTASDTLGPGATRTGERGDGRVVSPPSPARANPPGPPTTRPPSAPAPTSPPLSVPARSHPWPAWLAITAVGVLAVFLVTQPRSPEQAPFATGTAKSGPGAAATPSAATPPAATPPAATPPVATPPAATPTPTPSAAVTATPTSPTTPSQPATPTAVPPPPVAASPILPPATGEHPRDTRSVSSPTEANRARPAASPATATPAAPPCIEPGTFAGTLGRNTLTVTITRVSGRGVGATASIAGAGDSRASYALVGTCSDHVIRLMSPELKLQGTASDDGQQLVGTGDVGAGNESWRMTRR